MTNEQRPMKEFETQSSPQSNEEKSLDEVFREAAKEGSLYE